MTIVKIYCGTYHKYNSGSLKGEWIDLSDYDNKDEFLEYCAELHNDEEDPELMFQDYEAHEIFNGLISEIHISEKVWDIMEKLEDYDLDDESDQIALHNEYCEGDDQIFDGDTLDEVIDNMAPQDAFRLGAMSDFSWTGPYYRFNAYRGLESLNNPSDYIDWGVIQEAIL